MSTQEDFSEMSKDLHVQFLSNPWTIYETGCEDGYQYAIEKACDTLSQMLYTKRDDEHPAQHYTRSVESMGKFVSQTDFLNQFKQKMQ